MIDDSSGSSELVLRRLAERRSVVQLCNLRSLKPNSRSTSCVCWPTRGAVDRAYGASPSKWISQTLTESIRLSVTQDLSSSVLRPGQPIDERVLSEQFQVSRTSIRETIFQLAAQGFVVVGMRTGARIRGDGCQIRRSSQPAGDGIDLLSTPPLV